MTLGSSRWKWLTIKIPLRAAIPNTARNPTSEPSDSTPSLRRTAMTPPTRAVGSSRKVNSAGRKTAERRLQQQEDRQAGRESEEEQLVPRLVQLRRLAQHLGVVARGEDDAIDAVVDGVHRPRPDRRPRRWR